MGHNLLQFNHGFGLVAAFTSVERARTILVSLYGAVYRSGDHGATWTASSTGLPGFRIVDIVTLFATHDGTTVFAGNANLYRDSTGHFRPERGVPGLYRSNDGGITWVPNTWR